jgi:hypothetical protein
MTQCQEIKRDGLQCLRNNCKIHKRGTSDHVCAVCLDTTELRFVRKLPCNHVFCRPCIGAWLKNNNSCPTCRVAVKPPPRFKIQVQISVHDTISGELIMHETRQQEYLPLLAIEILVNDENEMDEFLREHLV